MLAALWILRKMVTLLTKMGPLLYRNQEIIKIFLENLVKWLSSEWSKFYSYKLWSAPAPLHDDFGHLNFDLSNVPHRPTKWCQRIENPQKLCLQMSQLSSSYDVKPLILSNESFYRFVRLFWLCDLAWISSPLLNKICSIDQLFFMTFQFQVSEIRFLSL